MSRSAILVLILVLIIVISAGTIIVYAKTQGFSAKAQPSRAEEFVAHRLLELSYPASARTLGNPLQATPEALADGKRSYTHDCAMCHGDDGLGQTEIGRGLYPKPPNLRQANDVPDGVLFYIVRNGVRFTGMPGSSDPDLELWKVVLYIRDLPNQPAGSQSAMQHHE